MPQAKFGTLGLMRADQIPDIHAIYVEKEELLPFAYGAKGIGEIATIPTAPAVQGAYYARDHILRTSLPMQDTFYKKPAKKAAPDLPRGPGGRPSGVPLPVFPYVSGAFLWMLKIF